MTNCRKIFAPFFVMRPRKLGILKMAASAKNVEEIIQLSSQNNWSFLETGMALTTSNIRKCIYQKNSSQDNLANRIGLISDAYKAKVDEMLYQVRLEQNNNWQTTSQEAALYWNKIIKEKILWKT